MQLLQETVKPIELLQSFSRHSCFVCVVSISLEVDRLRRKKSIYFYSLSALTGRRQSSKRDRGEKTTEVLKQCLCSKASQFFSHCGCLARRGPSFKSRLIQFWPMLDQHVAGDGNDCSKWPRKVLQPKTWQPHSEKKAFSHQKGGSSEKWRVNINVSYEWSR